MRDWLKTFITSLPPQKYEVVASSIKDGIYRTIIRPYRGTEWFCELHFKFTDIDQLQVYFKNNLSELALLISGTSSKIDELIKVKPTVEFFVNNLESPLIGELFDQVIDAFYSDLEAKPTNFLNLLSLDLRNLANNTLLDDKSTTKEDEECKPIIIEKNIFSPPEGYEMPDVNENPPEMIVGLYTKGDILPVSAPIEDVEGFFLDVYSTVSRRARAWSLGIKRINNILKKSFN